MRTPDGCGLTAGVNISRWQSFALPELSRRAVGWRLPEQTSNWGAVFGELARARTNAVLRPHLDLITAAIWWRVRDLGCNGVWRTLCLEEYSRLPLGALDVFESRGRGVRRGNP